MVSRQFEKFYLLLQHRRQPFQARPADKLRAGLESVSLPVLDDVEVERREDGVVPVERFTPPGASSDRVLLYLHGGGYVMGSARTHGRLAAELGRACGCTAVLPEYPLAPEHPYPAALDAVTALAGDLAGTEWVVAGDSAGGGLVLALLQRLRSAGAPLPRAAALLSPWVDLVRSVPVPAGLLERDPIVDPEDLTLMAGWYVGDADPSNPLISPVLADLAGLPPLLVQVGDAEVLHTDAINLTEGARSDGADLELEVWPGMTHVWHTSVGKIPEADDAVARAGEFLGAHLPAVTSP